jgi:hypothetical protein
MAPASPIDASTPPSPSQHATDRTRPAIHRRSGSARRRLSSHRPRRSPVRPRRSTPGVAQRSVADRRRRDTAARDTQPPAHRPSQRCGQRTHTGQRGSRGRPTVRRRAAARRSSSRQLAACPSRPSERTLRHRAMARQRLLLHLTLPATAAPRWRTIGTRRKPTPPRRARRTGSAAWRVVVADLDAARVGSRQRACCNSDSPVMPPIAGSRSFAASSSAADSELRPTRSAERSSSGAPAAEAATASR